METTKSRRRPNDDGEESKYECNDAYGAGASPGGVAAPTTSNASNGSQEAAAIIVVAIMIGIGAVAFAKSFLPVWAFAAVAFSALSSFVAVVFLINKRVQFLGSTEQVLVKTLTDKLTVNGPGIYFPSYLNVLSFKKRKAISLAANDYVLLKNTKTGEQKVVRGPASLLLGAFDELQEGVKSGTVLSESQGLIVANENTGTRRLVRGPKVFVPTPFERAAAKTQAIILQKDQFVKVEDTRTGEVTVVRGEQVLWLEPHQKQLPGGVKQAYCLKAHQYLRLRDSSGQVRCLRGEALIFPEPHEEALEGGVVDAIDLKPWEYCFVQDLTTGEIRCERGEKLLWLGPSDRVCPPGKQQAVTIDTKHAALVRNKNTGVQALVDKPQLFVPAADEEVLEVRELIRLAEHEAVVLKDPEGTYHIRFGDPAKGTERAFFLPPHWEVNTLRWSRGRRRERRDLIISVFDTRPQFMSFEFNTRTSDNVELVLEGTFFWEVQDIESMLKFTGDASGDVCAHARSCFIQLISKVTLSEFMDTFNDIAKEAHQADDSFYTNRGIKIHSLEVTRYQCADASTAGILEQIISETTNRMNRLSCQESENEVSLAKLHGEVEQENAKSEVLKIQQQHAVESARAEGLAEAERCLAFLEHIQHNQEEGSDDGSQVLVDGAGGKNGFSARLAEELWHTLRKGENVANIAKGSAHVYFTPEGANLTIENKSPVC